MQRSDIDKLATASIKKESDALCSNGCIDSDKDI